MNQRLPIRQLPEKAPSCEVYGGGLSREELGLAEEALRLKAELRTARSDAELVVLHERRAALAAQRQAAWRRKMIALGHLPPDAT